jgi:ABC-type sugar transport system ATPase subunit
MLELRGIDKRIGDFRLSGVDLRVEPDDYFVLMGPSGVGKTVLLEIIAGLLQPDSGQVLWQGRDVTAAPPEERRFVMAYQDYALFPQMDVSRNIGYGLRAQRVRPAEAARRVQQVAGLLDITSLLRRPVAGLSGGEKQRVSLARALVTEPRVMLLDEPLSSVDAGARLRLQRELRRLHQQTRTCFVHVTHDPEVAFNLGHRVAVMLEQRILQVGTPEELRAGPASAAVAELLGVPPVR